MKKLRLYKISEKYIHFLRETDPINVKYNKKERRPYVGVVLEIKYHSYLENRCAKFKELEQKSLEYF